MLKTFKLSNGKIVEDGVQGDILIYTYPDDAEKRTLVDVHGIDEHTLISAMDPDELSRLEFEPNHIAMIIKLPRHYSAKDEFLFKVSSLGVFLFSDRLIVVAGDDIPLFTSRLFSRVTSMRGLALRLIYQSIYHFLEHLKIINMMVDELEKKVNTSSENRHLLNMFTLEKSLVYYLSAINSNGMLLDKIKLSVAKMELTQEHIELLDDIGIENNQCYKLAEIYSNILASLMDARASIVGNNLNVLMKTLNLITIGIMVPTLVVSIFSMNVKMPFDHSNHTSFWIILALAAWSVVLFIFIWRRRSMARSGIA